jgi:hypothetical protein
MQTKQSAFPEIFLVDSGGVFRGISSRQAIDIRPVLWFARSRAYLFWKRL